MPRSRTPAPTGRRRGKPTTKQLKRWQTTLFGELIIRGELYCPPGREGAVIVALFKNFALLVAGSLAALLFYAVFGYHYLETQLGDRVLRSRYPNLTIFVHGLALLSLVVLLSCTSLLLGRFRQWLNSGKLRRGTLVKAHSLLKAGALNGARGRIVGTQGGRLLVLFEAPHGSKAVRAENLRRLTEAEARDGEGEEDEDEESIADDGASEEAEQHFLCPITLACMKDPVITPGGFTYERRAIRRWILDTNKDRKYPKDPLTNEDLRLRDLVPNRVLKNIIEEWRGSRGSPSVPVDERRATSI